MSFWDDSGYEMNDPKHPTYHERMVSVWDDRDKTKGREPVPAPTTTLTFTCDGQSYPVTIEVEPGVRLHEVIETAKLRLQRAFPGSDMHFRFEDASGVWDALTTGYVGPVG